MPTSRSPRPHVLSTIPRTVALSVAAVAVLLTSVGAAHEPAASSATATPAGRSGGADGGGTIEPSGGAPDEERPAPDPAAAAPTHAQRPREAAAPPVRLAPEGWLVAGGRSPVAGTGGLLVTYTVEVATSSERGIDVDGFAAAVTATLSDPEHGWTAAGRWRLQRIDDPRSARIRVLLAEPLEVDGLCARAGLDTRGHFSCWNGRIAALNVDRWSEGVAHVDDLALYRTYLVNHEVGHGLGYGHEDCRTPETLSPVMMQLTRATQGCVPNGAPYP